jgi:chromosome segregation ATPase
MSENGLVGQPVADVIETVVDCEDDDPKRVREILDPVTDDGVVTRDAVETAVADTSKVVATAETRTELAGIAYEDATAAAATVDDLEIVAARLDGYADRLDAVEARAVDLADDLRTPVEQLDDPAAVYELAMELRDVATTAQGVIRTADDLSQDLDEFEVWLTDSDRRYDEFAEDIDIIEESLAELATAAAALSTASETPAADWADATLRVRVMDLLVADLRAELAALRAWADRVDVQFRTGLTERVADVERKTTELRDTLAERAEPVWHDQFDDTISTFEAELDDFEPPVEWNRVQETLEQRRAQSFDSS